MSPIADVRAGPARVQRERAPGDDHGQLWLHRRVPRLACLLTLLSLALVAGACGGEDEKPLPAGDMRIATGLSGGVYRLYGRSLATVINRHLKPLRATALTTDGSVANLRLLERRRAEMAFTLADTAGPARAGRRRSRRPSRSPLWRASTTTTCR